MLIHASLYCWHRMQCNYSPWAGSFLKRVQKISIIFNLNQYILIAVSLLFISHTGIELLFQFFFFCEHHVNCKVTNY